MLQKPIHFYEFIKKLKFCETNQYSLIDDKHKSIHCWLFWLDSEWHLIISLNVH